MRGKIEGMKGKRVNGIRIEKEEELEYNDKVDG